jgi:hypothetical protein
MNTSSPSEFPIPDPNEKERRRRARDNRIAAFDTDHPQTFPTHRQNGDQSDPNRTFTKSLKRRGGDISDFGEPDPKAYEALIKAFQQSLPLGDFNAFETRAADLYANPNDPKHYRLTNPLAGLTLDSEAPDTHAIATMPPPAFTTNAAAAELVELYWMALLRDLPFAQFNGYVLDYGPLQVGIDDAYNDLLTYPYFRDFFGKGKNFRKEDMFKAALPGNPNGFAGARNGPHVSQFLLRGTDLTQTLDDGTVVVVRPAGQGVVAFGSQDLDQRQRTVTPYVNFLSDPVTWRSVQGGANLTGRDRVESSPLRFIRDPRDLANYVHFCKIYQEYYVTACILLTLVPRTGATKKGTHTVSRLHRLAAPSAVANEFQPPTPDVLNEGNPYRRSQSQTGFATFGVTHILTGLAEVASRAHRAVLFHKFMVHRRIRPEEFAGRVHFQLNGARNYNIDPQLVGGGSSQPAQVLQYVNQLYNSYLLPMAYPEGCPTHASFPAAHATLAGAATTMLKAFFNGDFCFDEVFDAEPVYGLNLTLLKNSDGSDVRLGVGDELDKLASNVAFARSMAGVHYRSDNVAGLLLGEQIAIGLLKEQSLGLPERDRADDSGKGIGFFKIKKFDGTVVEIANGTCKVVGGPGPCEQQEIASWPDI